MQKMMLNTPKPFLVYPPITKAERYGSNLGIFGGNQIPLGLYYLAGYLRRHGYEVSAVDGEACGLGAEDIVNRMRETSANVLGISSTTVAFHRALELAEFVKRELPGTVVIIGGPHVSCRPEHPLEFAAFDFAVRNEGEETLLKTLRMLEHGGDPAAVAGLIYRAGNEIRVNPKRAYIEDLDSLPFPAFDLIDDITLYNPPPFNYRRRPVANIITSRGCPNNCTFCERTTFGRKARLRSARNIVDEIEMLMQDFGVREFAFVDDTFTIKAARIHEIFELCRERGLSFPWTCMSRVNTVNRELLTYMRDNGCWYVAFGIESGDQGILKEIKKNITLDNAREVVGISSELGMRTKGFFMVGHPKETVESIDKTIDFARSLKLDHIVVTINTPMPGSYQYEHASEYGELDESAWAEFNYWNPVFVPDGLTREIIQAKHKEFLKRFYCRPGMLLKQARIIFLDRKNLLQFFRLLYGLARYYLIERKGYKRHHG